MSRGSIKSLTRLINSEVACASTEKRFLNDLINHIERNDEKREPSKSYKPSSLKCTRQMYYQLVGAPVDQTHSDAGLVGMGESGTDRHNRIQEAIQRLCKHNTDYEWVDIETYVLEKGLKDIEIVRKDGNETKCRHKVLNLSFMCDGILKIKGKYYILEIKTESSFKFMRRQGVADEHKTQASCYSVAFEIEDVIFLYENRDTIEKKIYMLHVTNEMRQELVIDKILDCDNYVKKMEVPPKSKVKKDCQYCRYIKTCEDD